MTAGEPEDTRAGEASGSFSAFPVSPDSPDFTARHPIRPALRITNLMGVAQSASITKVQILLPEKGSPS